MLQALPYMIGFGMPLSVYFGYAWGGVWTFQTVLGLCVAIPADLAPISDCGDQPGAESDSDANPAFRWVIWVWVPVQLALLAWALVVMSSVQPSLLERIGVTVSVGLTTGIVGITFAHELTHRSNRFERALAELLLSSVNYPHFSISHVTWHHMHVATPHDPSTARFGEGFYAFLIRTVWGNLRVAWRCEARRLEHRHPRRRLSRFHNRMIRYGALLACIYAAIAWFGGSRGLAFFAGQSLVAVVLLELSNYVQHYGLTRRETAPGRYEPIRAHHSWDSGHLLTNRVLINLARHADHHLLPGKRYHTLNHLEAAAQLPAGYGAMFILALIPPVWRTVMDPRVLAWRSRYQPNARAIC